MTPRLAKAIDFMRAAHAGQMRRDGVRPFEVHPLDVMQRVAVVARTEDLSIAALLHDTVESIREGAEPSHPEYDLDAIRDEFGANVADIVWDLTDRFIKKDYPDLNRKARKELERRRYSEMSSDARLIKIADICSNMSDLDGGDRGFALLYLKEKALCLPMLRENTLSNTYLYGIAERILQEQLKRFNII